MPRLWKLCMCGLVWAVSFAGAPRARADVAPPGLQECAGKTLGDACDYGACRQQTCSRLDYEHWDRDAGGAPPTVKFDCVLCVGSGGQSGGGSGGSGGQSGGGSGGSARQAGAGGAESAATGDSGCAGCTTGGGEFGLRSAALGFALFMGLLLGTRRRRSSR